MFFGVAALVALVSDATFAARWVPELFLLGAGFRFAATCLNPARGGLGLLVDFFVLFFVAVPAKVQVDSAEYPFGGTYVDADIAKAYLVFAVGQIAYLVALGLSGAREESPTRGAGSPVDAAVLMTAAWSALLVGLMTAIYVTPQTLRLPRFELESYMSSAPDLVGQATLIGRGVSLFGILVCLFMLRHVAGATRRPQVIACSAVSLVAVVVLNFPASLPRFQLLGLGLAVATLAVSTFDRRIKLAFAAVGPTFLFFLFPAVKVLGSGERVDVGAAFGSDVLAYLHTEDFDCFKQMMDSLRYLEDYPYRGADSFVGALLFWVPRSMWPGKPVHSGEVVSTALHYPFNNVSSPLAAEGYLAFGFAGLVIVMAALGWFVASIERAVTTSSRQGVPAATLILYALCVGWVVILLRGALVGVFPMVGPSLLAYVAVARLSRRGSGPERTRNRRLGLKPRPTLRSPAQ